MDKCCIVFARTLSSDNYLSLTTPIQSNDMFVANLFCLFDEHWNESVHCLMEMSL